MENKAHALAAGIFVVLMGLLLSALTLWLARQAGDERKYELVTREAVTGLQSQGGVRYRGVKVGRVDSIDLDPSQPGLVRVRLAVRADTPVTRATYASLGYQGLTGIAFVQLDEDGEDSGQATPLTAAPGQLPRIPMRAGWMDQWTHQGEHLLGQLTQATERFNQLLAPENQRALRQSLDTLQLAAAEVPPTLQEARQSFAAIRQSATSISASSDHIRTAVDDYAALARHLERSGGAVDQIQQALGALVATGQFVQQSTLPRLNRTLDAADRSAQSAGRAANHLDENPQSLIFGAAPEAPGPGENGFRAPTSSPPSRPQ